MVQQKIVCFEPNPVVLWKVVSGDDYIEATLPRSMLRQHGISFLARRGLLPQTSVKIRHAQSQGRRPHFLPMATFG